MFRLYRDTGEEEWSIRAEKLLDDIWNGCTEDMSLAYGDGLCGIGAGTEYLIQNGFVEGDADEILAEIDSRVFAAINARPPFDLSIEQGISGLACYLYHRLCYRKDSEEPVVLNLKEYTIYLIDWIAEALQDDATGKDYYEVYFHSGLIAHSEYNECQNRKSIGMVRQGNNSSSCKEPIIKR